jgi:hypothetical protein
MRLNLTLASAIALALAACSGPLTRDTGSSFTKITGFYNYGASGRDLPLSVRGNPFGQSDAGVAKSVEAASQVQVLRAPTHPTLTPGASARRGYELAFLFSPAPTQSGDDLCQGRIEDPGPAPKAGKIHVLGAFCVSGRAETEVVGDGEATGPDDEHFRALVQQVTLQLFRPDIPDSGDGTSGR